MPNIKSAIKRVDSNARKAAFNKSRKSELKTYIKRAEKDLEASADHAADSVRMTQAKLDKAVHSGLIHKNKAARKTSQLARRLNEMS